MTRVPVEVSARHCHLNQKDIDRLFGSGYKLKILKMISQPGQYAAQEEIKIKGPKGELNLRIVGPARTKTQIELSVTECYRLGIKPVLRISGSVSGTPGAVLIGPKGQIEIKQGVIVTQRHIHLSVSEAKKWKLKNLQLVSVKIKGSRGLIFDQVVVRVASKHKKSFQIDTDEANACGWESGMQGEFIK